MRQLRFAVAISLAMAGSALGAGFAIPDQSARALGTAGTGTASSVGGETIYYNPARLVMQDAIVAEVTGLAIIPTFKWQGVNGTSGDISAKNRFFVIPSIYIGSPISDDLAVGIGFFSNFGLGVTWPDTFPGRFLTSDVTLMTYTINPTVSYQLADWVSVGGGVDIVRGTLDLSSKLGMAGPNGSDGNVELVGGGWGVSANLGMAMKFLDEKLDVGLSWRSATHLKLSGTADFTVSNALASQFPQQGVNSSLTLPHLFTAGVSYRFTEKVRGSVDLIYTTWSSLQNLHINLVTTPAANSVLVYKWNDTVSVRGGVEIDLSRAFTLRAGAGYDSSPAPAATVSPSIPDSDRLIGTLGVGTKMGNLGVDLGYMLLDILQRDTSAENPFPARYSGLAHLVGATVSFRL